jgi:hypothetical protein
VLNVEIDLRGIEGAGDAFKRMPERLKKHLRVAMVDSLSEVLKGAFDRVHVISGTLRRSITTTHPIENMSGGYDGKIGTNLAYARMEEYGYRGPQNVKAFQRSSAFGRPTRLYTVPAFTRNINRPEHPYLRPALAAARESIIQFHRQAVTDTLSEMNAGGAA